jgi:ATP-binding cassette subfamily C (CFTR/MRP) protein 1
MTIDGISLTTLSRQNIRDRLITIPQDSFIIEHLTWQENLQPSKTSTVTECESVLKDINLLEAIQNAGGLDAIAKPDILSHGQKQLFGLARAVLKGRQKFQLAAKLAVDAGENYDGGCGGLLLLDEIASSVDEDTEKIMQGIILKEFKKYTILAVAHRAGSMSGFDSVIVMEDGRIKEKGSAREILT